MRSNPVVPVDKFVPPDDILLGSVIVIPKVGSSMWYIRNLPSLQFPAMNVSWTARVKPDDQRKDQMQLALELRPGSPEHEAVKAIDEKILQQWFKIRKSDWPKGNHKSDESLREEMHKGARPPPPDKPEYSPTFRVRISMKERADGAFVVSTPMFSNKQAIMTDVEEIKGGSKVMVIARPGWVHAGQCCGITWVADSVLLLEEPSENKFPFVGVENILPPPEPKEAAPSSATEAVGGDESQALPEPSFEPFDDPSTHAGAEEEAEPEGPGEEDSHDTTQGEPTAPVKEAALQAASGTDAAKKRSHSAASKPETDQPPAKRAKKA